MVGRWVWLSTVALLASPALADTVEASDAAQVAEIVVTGQKADRTLQDTPASVGVTTAQDVTERNLIDVYDALTQTANVTVPAGKQGFNIRGIDAFNVSGAGEGALASVYLDGAPLPQRAVVAGPLDLYDVAQIEVYRGPQSTLQGRNALAGAVIIRTTDPDFTWSGRARAMLTDKDEGRRFSAAVGGPIIDGQVAFRVAGEVSRADGLIYGVNTGSEYSPRKSETLRGKLLLTPEALPGLRIVAGYMHDRHIRGGDYVEFQAPYAKADRVTLFNTPNDQKVVSDIATLDASYEISPRLRLTSVSNYSRVIYNYSYDQDFSAAAIGVASAYEPAKTFSQEFRLNFNFERLQGLIGAYYSDEDKRGSTSEGTQRINFSTVGIDRQLVAPPPAGFGLDQATANFVMDLYPGRGVMIFSRAFTPRRTTNRAIFGDATWAVADRLKLNAGFRWDHEKQVRGVDQIVTLQSQLPDPAAVPIAALRPLIAGINQVILGQVAGANNREPEASITYSAFLPKVGLTYDLTPDAALSASVQRGYRSGGSGTNIFRAHYFTYEPEFTWNYELALRTTWLDRRLTINANAFLIDWKDQQVTVQLTPGNVYDTQTFNAGASRLWGFEVESRFRPTPTLTINAGVGYTRTKFTDFEVAAGGTIFAATGNEFAASPRWSANLSATWRPENGFVANVNANYASAAFLGSQIQTRREIDARTLVNGRVGWENDRYGVFVFASNLFNAKYTQTSFVSGGRLMGIIGDPRIVGASVEGRF